MINILKKYGEVFENASLKELNTYRIGGLTKYLIYPENQDKLQELIIYLKDNGIKYKVLGNGSNIIVGSKTYDGVVIKLSNLCEIQYDEDKMIVSVGAGVMLPKLAYDVIDHGFSGFEWAAGIPGTVGGSIIGNAGAYNTEIFDIIETITYLDENNQIVTVNAENVKFEYRHSEFRDRDVIILSAVFRIEMGNKAESLELIHLRRTKRIESQPLEYPSAGSVFRNPLDEELAVAYQKYDLKGPFAGHLIEECGLKGKRVNGAKISDKHANFIINEDNATSEDIKALIDLVRDEIKTKYNCELRIEQEFFNF